jgi:GNAT superfamily N-acetyltransferase
MPAAIRRATKDGAAQIAEIIAEISSDPDPVGFAETLSTEEVVAWIDRQGDNGVMLVVDDGRQVLGFAALDFDSSQPSECSFGAWLRARNRRQGHGHGTALAEEALACRKTTSLRSRTSPRSGRWCR